MGPLPRLEALAAVISRSPISLEVPITLVGLTALSDDASRTLLAPFTVAASMTFCVPKIFVWTASRGDSVSRQQKWDR